MALTNKQERFCNEYMIDLNATQAAIRSGYSENTAKAIGCENLTKLDIQERIAELQKEISERNKITVDECIGILAKLTRFDIAELYDSNGNLKNIHDIDKDSRLSLEGVDTETYTNIGIEAVGTTITKKVKIGNRKQAIDMLLKHLGGYEKDNSQKQIQINGIKFVE